MRRISSDSTGYVLSPFIFQTSSLAFTKHSFNKYHQQRGQKCTYQFWSMYFLDAHISIIYDICPVVKVVIRAKWLQWLFPLINSSKIIFRSLIRTLNTANFLLRSGWIYHIDPLITFIHEHWNPRLTYHFYIFFTLLNLDFFSHILHCLY